MFKALVLAALIACSFTAYAEPTEINPPTGAAKEYFNAGKTFAANSQWKAALENLQKAVKLEPESADIHNLLGYSYRKSGKLTKAFEHYTIALKLNPKHTGAHEYVGEAYLMANDPANAEKHLKSLESICGKSCEQYQNLARAIEAYKDPSKAGTSKPWNDQSK